MCFDAIEVTQAFQALLASFDLDHVEGFARRDGEFAADNAVFGLGISFDLDLFDYRFLAFLNFVSEIDRAGLSIGIAMGDNRNVIGVALADVTFGAVKVLDHLHVFLQVLRLEDGTDRHLQSTQNVVGGDDADPFEIDGADAITTTLGDDEINDDFTGRFVEVANVLQFEVDVAGIAIEFGQTVLVVFELLILKHAAASQPGEHPVATGLDDFAQLVLGKCVSTFKQNIIDFDFGRLSDFKGDGSPAAALVRMGNSFDFGLGIAGKAS